MNVPLFEAETKLTELVRLAEAGEEIVLTAEGRAAVKLVPVKPSPTPAEKLTIIKDIQARVRAKGPHPSSKELQAALYDEHGLPK